MAAIASQENAKRLAGRKVIDEFITDGMKLGLGSGTTSHFFVRELGKHVAAGLQLTCTTTSHTTSLVAQEVGMTLTDPNDIGELDLTVDGADEIDQNFHMIKGGGACLLWEKIIAQASKQMITVCDESKIVDKLGAFPLPVEIVQFAWQQTVRRLRDELANYGIEEVLLMRRTYAEKPVITDSGNFIIDCHCGVIDQPAKIELALNMIPGVVENGLFTRESAGIAVGCQDGTSFVKLRSSQSG